MSTLTGHLKHSSALSVSGLTENSEAWLYSLRLSPLKSRDSPVLVVLQGLQGDFKSVGLHNGYLEPVKRKESEKVSILSFLT